MCSGRLAAFCNGRAVLGVQADTRLVIASAVNAQKWLHGQKLIAWKQDKSSDNRGAGTCVPATLPTP